MKAENVAIGAVLIWVGLVLAFWVGVFLAIWKFVFA